MFIVVDCRRCGQAVSIPDDARHVGITCPTCGVAVSPHKKKAVRRPAAPAPVEQTGPAVPAVAFEVAVRDDPALVFKGRLRVEADGRDVRLVRPGKIDVVLPRGTPARLDGGKNFSVELEDRWLSLSVVWPADHQGRVARDVVDFLSGHRPTVRAPAAGPRPSRSRAWLVLPTVVIAVFLLAPLAGVLAALALLPRGEDSRPQAQGPPHPVEAPAPPPATDKVQPPDKPATPAAPPPADAPVTRRAPGVVSFSAQPGAVTSLAFSRDARTLITAHATDVIRFWDLAQFTKAAELPGRGPLVPGPDGSWLLCGAASGLKRLSVAERRFLPEAGAGDAARLSADGRVLFVVGQGQGRRYLPASGVESPAWPLGPPGTAWDLSPDGQVVAVWQKEAREVRFRDAATGEVMGRGPRRAGDPGLLAFSPNGELVATLEKGGREVELLANVNGRLERTLKPPDGLTVGCLAFSPAGKFLAVGGAGRAWLAEVASGRAVADLKADLPSEAAPAAAVQFSADGSLLALGSGEWVSVWDLARVKPEAVDRPDGVAASPRPLPVEVELKERASFQLAVKPGPAGVLWAPSERGLMSFSTAPDVVLWSLDRKGHVGVIRLPRDEDVATAALSPDGRQIAVGTGDGQVHVVNFAQAMVIRTLPRPRKGLTPEASALAFSPDGTRLATLGETDGVRWWEVATGKELGAWPEGKAQVKSLAWSPDGQKLILGGTFPDGPQVLTLATKQREGLTGAERQPAPLVAASPDGKTLAAGRADGSVSLFDLASGEERRVLRGHPKKGVTCLAFRSDGRLLATGGDGVVRLWNVETGEEGPAAEVPLGAVRAVAFAPDGSALAAGAQNHTVRVWDLKPQAK